MTMTLDELLAREAIRHSIATYTIAGDIRDRDAFMTVWAEEAVFEFAEFPPLPGFRFRGLAEIDPATRWLRYGEMEKALGGSSFLRHNLTTSPIELSAPDRANARTYFVVFTDIGPDHSGTYDDVIVRRGDRWLIAHRRIRLDWRSPDSLFPLVDKQPRD